jgi:hypothetical protein
MAEDYHKSREELETELAQQVETLDDIAREFNGDRTYVAKPLATILRMLLHDSGGKRSVSLLAQLGMKGLLFWDTADEEVLSAPLPNGHFQFAAAYHGLVGSCMGAFIPHLDGVKGSPRAIGRQVDYDTWWNATVIRDSRERAFSRKRLVLSVADADGGAHVDSTLPPDYAELTRRNSLGMKYAVIPGEEFPKVCPPASMVHDMPDPVFPSIRQIAHEVLKTLKGPTYTKYWASVPGPIMGMLTVIFKREPDSKKPEDS